MECQDCRTEMRVKRTYPSGTDKVPTTARVHECACGSRFLSEEAIARRLPSVAISSPPVARGTAVNDPPNGRRTAVNEPKTARPCDSSIPNGGFGGSVSSGSDLTLFPADPAFSQLPDPDLSEEADQEVDPACAKQTDPEFEAFWRAIESNRPKGSKIKAEKSWKKGGRPPASLLVTKWKAYRLSIGDGWASDVVTWLNIPGWLEDWEPAPATTVRNGHPSGHSPSPYRPIPTLPAGVPRPR